MKTHLSNLALGAASMFLATSAFAYIGIDDRLDVLEKEMQEVSARNPQGTLGTSFVTSRPEVDGTNWYIALDVIYWHPKMGGTEYAITYAPSDFLETPGFPLIALSHRPHGGLKENDFSWDLGVKVGVGYKTPHDSWDVFARYTWFESHSTSQTSKNFPSAIIPTKLSVPSPLLFITDEVRLVFNFFANKAKSTVDIDYNNIDLELARRFFISKEISVRPHIGAKAAWIDIFQSILYVQDRNPDFTALLFTASNPDAKVNLTSKFKGIGPRMGLDTKYFVGDGFNLFGDVALSILYGHFKTRQKDRVPDFDLGGLAGQTFDFIEDLLHQIILAADSQSLTNKFHQFVSFAQIQLGFEWNKYINNNKQHLGLKVGYEIHYYWRVNQIGHQNNALGALQVTFSQEDPDAITTIAKGRHSNDKVSEDLMFYGITAEARLDF